MNDERKKKVKVGKIKCIKIIKFGLLLAKRFFAIEAKSTKLDVPKTQPGQQRNKSHPQTISLGLTKPMHY